LLWQSKGRSKEALHLLQSISAEFSEGFDTTDLQRAEEILNILKQNTTRQPGNEKALG
jgi:hypothetical protein